MIYLPPYSPDFNPIEKVFACFKMRLWRKCTLTGRESDADKIEDCLRQVATPTLISSSYCDCGYLNWSFLFICLVLSYAWNWIYLSVVHVDPGFFFGLFFH
jgi:hypothetical protein